MNELDNTVDVMEIAEGNIGTLACVMAAVTLDPARAVKGLNRMQQAGITGDKLYMLWNDCCACDIARAIKVMNTMDVKAIAAKINYENGRGIPISEAELEGGTW